MMMCGMMKMAQSFTPEAYLAVDELKKTTLTKGQKKQLTQTINEVKDKNSHLWNCPRSTRGLAQQPQILPKGCRTFLLEIFAGAALLSLLATDIGFSVSQPVDVTYDGINLKYKHIQAPSGPHRSTDRT